MSGFSRATAVAVSYGATGATNKPNEFGMREMQEMAYAHRGEQYLLIKSPPASGKSRALMFIALDKLANQGVGKAIIAVPETSIGASFADEPLSKHGFWADWSVAPQWNLCNAPGADDARVAKSKVKAVGEFLKSPEKTLVCTHATFRFAVDDLGVEAFDDCMIAIDEFHHVSADRETNRLGDQLSQIIDRGKAHIVAMTGSYFRGDAVPVLHPDDEEKFKVVTYTYYQQLSGYRHLKALDVGYFFYDGVKGPYVTSIMDVLDTDLKTILHIPNVNSRESTTDKIREVQDIMHQIGSWKGVDPRTGFHLIERRDGKVLKVADLVDDEPAKRAVVMSALKAPAVKANRDHVDIIIALGMAKEGFDWIWCEHALTVGYRASMTEVIQIIGRATRDADGKARARFTNFIQVPDATRDEVAQAVNDTLKAIAAALLMEQVLAPPFNYTPKTATSEPLDGFDYGEGGYDPERTNVGVNPKTGEIHIEVRGMTAPTTEEARAIVRNDMPDLLAQLVQNQRTLELGLNTETVPQEVTLNAMGRIVRERYPSLSEQDQEFVRESAVAALNVTQVVKEAAAAAKAADPTLTTANALIEGARRFNDVREIDIDLIESVNPFGDAYSILAKSLDSESLKQIEAIIKARKAGLTPEEALELGRRAVLFQRERGRPPSLSAQDPWERRMAEGIAYLKARKAEQKRNG
jgi:hypothetical protein